MLAASILLVFVLIGSFWLSPDEETMSSPGSMLPLTPSPDADSPADTIKTLTATVTSLTQDMAAIRQDNANLLLDRENLENQVATFEARMSNQLQIELSRQQLAQQQFLESLEALADRVDRMGRPSWESTTDPVWGNNSLPTYSQTNTAWQWLSPLEQESSGGELTVDPSQTYPKLTIPQNATLVGATTLTALIGRVPVENSVVDPMPFKVITGQSNLAANGHTIGGLAGSVWRGHAIGDWTLSCVSADLTSVTFIFRDGRIATFGENQPDSPALAWLSDNYGAPCIPGERKSNMKTWLVAQMGSGLLKGTAEAASVSQTTQQSNALGTLRSTIDGDLAKYLIGNSIASSTTALSSWIEQRAEQEFDAVVVPTAQTVAIHVDRAIPIDYEENGRKLHYDEIRLSATNFDLH